MMTAEFMLSKRPDSPMTNIILALFFLKYKGLHILMLVMLKISGGQMPLMPPPPGCEPGGS